ncbi:hypothetical protein ACXYN8_08825 [Altererythrobacter sp. CAU 1778]
MTENQTEQPKPWIKPELKRIGKMKDVAGANASGVQGSILRRPNGAS